MRSRLFHRLLPVLALCLLAGCAVPINRQIDPDRLRDPGLDTIAGAEMADGGVIEFDMEPATHSARVIGDTLYCFIAGDYQTLPMSEVRSLTVHLFLPLPDAGAIRHVTIEVGEKSIWLGKAIWDAFKRSAPVLLPAGLMFMMWKAIR